LVGWPWWYKTVIPALRRLRRKDGVGEQPRLYREILSEKIKTMKEGREGGTKQGRKGGREKEK
jgi:hypothetical protein